MADRRKRNRQRKADQYAAVTKAWREQNKERNAAVRRANKEGVAKWNKTYRQNNPEKFQGYQRKRRALKASLPSEPYTRQDIIDRDGTDCGLCGEPVDLELKYPDHLSPSIDHVIPITRQGPDTLANVQLAHLICNIRKHNHLEEKDLERAS
jgi:5-methylcytosine-specific restriction endonuclease McrA